MFRRWGAFIYRFRRPVAVLAVILAVAHRQFAELGGAGVRALCKDAAVVYDVKHVLPRDAVDGRL